MIDSPRVLAIINAIDKRHNRRNAPHPENWAMLPVLIFHEWLENGSVPYTRDWEHGQVLKSREQRDQLVGEGSVK